MLTVICFILYLLSCMRMFKSLKFNQYLNALGNPLDMDQKPIL